MLLVGYSPVACPLVLSVEQFYHSLREYPLQVAQQYDVVLAMVVYPAAVALLGMSALNV